MSTGDEKARVSVLDRSNRQAASTLNASTTSSRSRSSQPHPDTEEEPSSKRRWSSRSSRRQTTTMTLTEVAAAKATERETTLLSGEKRSVLSTAAPAIPPAATTRTVTPGAMRVFPTGRDGDEPSSRMSLVEENQEQQQQQQQQQQDAQQPSAAYVAEVVDQDELRRQALQETVVAQQVQIWNSQADLGDDSNDDQDQEHSQALKQTRKRRIMAACLVLIVVIVVVVVAVSVSSGNGGSGSGKTSPNLPNDNDSPTDSILMPSPSPTTPSPTTPSPTIAPTANRFRWEQGQVLTGLFPDIETPPHSEGIGGGFGYDVAVATSPGFSAFSVETPPSSAPFFASSAPVVTFPEPTGAITVVATFDSDQEFFFRRRQLLRQKYHQVGDSSSLLPRRLGFVSHINQLATFRCDSQGQCNEGSPEEIVLLQDPFSPNLVVPSKIVISQDGRRRVLAADGQLWHEGGPFSEATGILFEVAANANVDFVAGLGSSLNVFDLFENDTLRFSRPETTSAVAVAVCGRRVAFGDNGVGIEVLDDNGNPISLPIQQQGTVVGSGSLSFAAEGTILAVGTTFEGMGQVQVWQLSQDDNDWIPMGLPIVSTAQGDEFGASVALSPDGTIVAVAAPADSTNGLGSGRVSVFWWSGKMQKWSQLGNDIFGLSGSGFGSSLAISRSGSQIVVGAPESSRIGPRTGEVNIFTLGEIFS